jgi:hypothetical protein
MKVKNVEARIAYYGKNEHGVDRYTTKLDPWLKGELEFTPVKYAKFEKMTLSVVEFDKDHCIYILLPESVFRNIYILLPESVFRKEN